MARIEIHGGVPLHGEVWVSGAKNAVLPILVASLLGDESSRISNVPHLQDVTTTMELLGRMGAELGLDEPETVADFFSIADASRLVFTSGATESLNMALFGLLNPGDHAHF